jgi:peptide-methionine (R)-S-oxide reductase
MIKQPDINRSVGLNIDTTTDLFVGSPWRRIADDDWKRRLTPLVFSILRHEGTEAPGASPLNTEHRDGLFVCAGCELPLFKSEWKFDSGTGWPSFFKAFHEHIAIKPDNRLGSERIEYHCARCLGHQGHIFDDGPKPTGLRHCNDGGALRFLPS